MELSWYNMIKAFKWWCHFSTNIDKISVLTRNSMWITASAIAKWSMLLRGTNSVLSRQGFFSHLTSYYTGWQLIMCFTIVTGLLSVCIFITAYPTRQNRNKSFQNEHTHTSSLYCQHPGDNLIHNINSVKNFICNK